MKQFLIKIIDVYQRTLSPDKSWRKEYYPGGYCKYHPHCSEYGKQVIGKYGLIKGISLAIWRILRCNSWSKGGWDPVK